MILKEKNIKYKQISAQVLFVDGTECSNINMIILVGSIDNKSIKCNDIPTDDHEGIVTDNWVYAFRTDIALDYNIRAEDIEKDIEILKENHLYNFAQKNARYRYSYYGVADDLDVKENDDDDLIDKNNLDLRKDYTDDFHVNTTYTAYAQYWLIKRMLSVDNLNYVCDEDNSIITALMRVYADKIKHGNVNIFTAK